MRLQVQQEEVSLTKTHGLEDVEQLILSLGVGDCFRPHGDAPFGFAGSLRLTRIHAKRDAEDPSLSYC
jgi:hypothetical protein